MLCLLALIAGGAAVGLILAQDSPDRPLSYAELLDKANRAYAKKNFREAARLHEKLLEENPKDIVRLMLVGNCYFELYQTTEGDERVEFEKKAREKYEAVLAEESQNLLANAHLARLLALQSKTETGVDQNLLVEVKAKLLEAGFNGYRALEALNTYSEFGVLSGETQFQVSLITKPKEYQYTAHGQDPFNNPLPRVIKTEPTDGKGTEVIPPIEPLVEELPKEEQQRIIREIEDHIEELEKALRANDFEKVSIKWREIEALFTTKAGNITEAQLRGELTRLNNRFTNNTKKLRSLELQHLYQQGRKIIDEMRVQLERNELNQVRLTYQRLQKHTEMMKRKDPGYALPADELLAEGEPLDRKAELLLSITQLELKVTGIIEGRIQGLDVDRAIINDKIYSAGDKVFDVSGKLVRGLIVFAVSSSQKIVRFRLEDVEFSRPLQSPDGAGTAVPAKP